MTVFGPLRSFYMQKFRFGDFGPSDLLDGRPGWTRQNGVMDWPVEINGPHHPWSAVKIGFRILRTVGSADRSDGPQDSLESPVPRNRMVRAVGSVG